MAQLIKMAFRDLMRNRRRSFLSSLALGLGLALLVLMAGTISGEMRSAMDTSIKLQSGHLQVRAATYDENKTSLAWKDLVENPDQVAAKIAGLSQVAAATPRLYVTGILVSGSKNVGVRIIGFDPASSAYAPILQGMVAGQFLTADDRAGILIGKTLADKLAAKPGDQISLLANTSNGDVDQQPFTIRGVYSTHTAGFDEFSIFMPLAKAQAIAQADNHASTIFVLLKDVDQTQAVADSLKSNQFSVITYKQANSILADTEQLANSYIYLLYLIVLGITATVIVNTLLMSVFERTREIGILAALGMRPSQIRLMFFIESTLLAIGGVIIGLIIGILITSYVEANGFAIGNVGLTGMLVGERIYAHLTLQDTVILTILTFIISLLAALYPASLASRLEPVDALHGGK